MRPWIQQTVGGLPRPFWYVWATMLVNRIGSFVLIVLAFYLTQVRGFQPAFAGLVIGLWGAGGAVGTLLGGVLADRWGRKPTFVTMLYLTAALTLTLGFVRGPAATIVTVFALGLATEGARPAVQALMIDVVPEPDRLRAFSLYYWVINLGFASAAVMAGFVAHLAFLLLFILDAATTVAAATLVAFAIAEPRRLARPAPTGRPKPRGPGLRAVFADRVFMAYVGVNLLTALIFSQHVSTLPLAMARDGLPASTYGTVIALNGILIVAAQLFVHRVLRRLRRHQALAVSAIVTGVGFGLIAFAHQAWFYAVTVLVWTLGEILNAPSNSATNAELSPPDLRGRYQGVFSLSWSLAAFLAPIVGAATFQYLGNTALWLGCFGVAVVVAALHLVAGPARERRAAELVTGQPSGSEPGVIDPARPADGVTPVDVVPPADTGTPADVVTPADAAPRTEALVPAEALAR